MKIFRAMVNYETPQRLQFNHERAVYADSLHSATALLEKAYPRGVRYVIYEAYTIDEFSPGADLLDEVLGADGARLRD
jgi:hypothetical protein